MCFVNPLPRRRGRAVPPFLYDHAVLVRVPPAELWALLEQPAAYPRWWPWLDLHHDHDHGELTLREGSVVRATIRAPLPYHLRLRIRVVDLQAGRAIRAEVTGDLAGHASVVLAEHPEGTRARLSWQLVVGRPALRALAVVARPALEWGHDRIVADGVAQFARATGVPARASGDGPPTGPIGQRVDGGVVGADGVGTGWLGHGPAGEVGPGAGARWPGARWPGAGPDAGGWIGDGTMAAVAAGTLSGAPSTVHAVVTGASPLAAARAAGEVLGRPGLGRGALAHAGISLGWGLAMAAALPRRRTVAAGALGGLAIAAVDLGLVAGVLAPRRLRGIRRLPVLPQVADHVAFGALAGAVIAARRRSRTDRSLAGLPAPVPEGEPGEPSPSETSPADRAPGVLA